MIHIITPVKDSIERTLKTVEAVCRSGIDEPHTYTVYNDFSTEENTRLLEQASAEQGFALVNMSEVTTHPSPNYRLVLQMAQQAALEAGAVLVIVESDVIVAPDTIARMAERVRTAPKAGILAAVTVDEHGAVNYPYLFAAGMQQGTFSVRKHLSFCCSALSPALLQGFDFHQLDPTKSWFDVFISHKSLKLGLDNLLCTDLPVYHSPHGSRPHKLLKKTNPFRYYWQKLVHGRDKI